MFNAIKNCIKNWCRICRNKKANTIVLKVHKISIEYNLSWHAAVKKRLGEVGIGMESNITDIVLHGESNITDIHTAAFEKLNITNLKSQGTASTILDWHDGLCA